MPASSSDWSFADAWVFAAIGVYDRPCSIAELVAAADAINNSVPIEADLVAALGKLGGSGLVRIFEDWTFELTDDGTSLWSGGAGYAHGKLPFVQEQLAAIDPVSTVLNSPDGVFEEALREYASTSQTE